MVRRTTNHEELTLMNFPERDDVQWIKNMNRHRSNDVWIAAESEVDDYVVKRAIRIFEEFYDSE